MGTLTRAAAFAAAATMMGALGGCAQSDDSLPPRLQSITPTVTPSPAFTPVTPPVDSRTVTGPYFSISVPGSWTDRTQQSSTAEVKPVLIEKPENQPGNATWVGILVDKPAKSDVIEQSLVLETEKKSTGATHVTRETVTWPGAERSVLVGWRTIPGGGGSGEVRYLQLMAQTSPGTIVNAIAFAPAAEWDATGMEDILATLVLTP